jgi:Na+/proline symporter
MVFGRGRSKATQLGFLVAGRDVGWIVGGASIAASWIWAPALFISSQIAYQKGVAGVFWFTFPNVVALAMFAWLAPAVRTNFPQGYTLPQYMRRKLGSERVHRVYLFPFFFYQLMAVAVQLYAGGSFFSLLTGVPLVVVMPLMTLITLGYTWISGLTASIITDFFQMFLIFVIGLVIVCLMWLTVGGWQGIAPGLGGIEKIGSIFDPEVAFSFGIVTSIGLISGALSDQQYWQRAFAIRQSELKKAFLFGAILFGVIPLMLSLLGFVAANDKLAVHLPADYDVALIGVQAVATLLPAWAILIFIVMLLAGLCSTLDSGLAAASSLWATDVAEAKTDETTRAAARSAMLVISTLGLGVAISVNYIPGFGLKHLWWVMNTISACVAVPTLLSLFWKPLHERGVFWGVLLSFGIGVPFFVYANVMNSAELIVTATLTILLISGSFCWVLRAEKG